MSHTPIQKVTIQKCGCVRKSEVNLTRLHALIGPNDSGKSTILRALRTATQFATNGFTQDEKGEFLPFVPLLGETTVDGSITLSYGNSDAYVVLRESGRLFENALTHGSPMLSRREVRPLVGESRLWTSPNVQNDFVPLLAQLKTQLSLATLVRFDPDALRAAAAPLLDTESVGFADERGTGLAAVYDAILNRDRDAFDRIQEQARELFPTLKRIDMSVPTREMRAMKAMLKDGKGIDAREMSEGLLYFLGFAALQYCGSSLLLVEEPENGLHPSRIPDVMDILRKISETAQVVIATHSPLVINEMKPGEVTVVTRDENGTHCKPIGETPGFADRSKVYALGELWLSYANGKDEAPLLKGGARE